MLTEPKITPLTKDNCIFCGAQATEQIQLKDTFTAYQLLQAGDKACNRCEKCLNTPDYRRNCWYSKTGTDFNKITDMIEFLQNMPEPPFVLYTTKQKRKHGWIIAVQNPILTTEQFILVCDEEKILFTKKQYQLMLSFAELLFKLEVPKNIMLNGYPPVWAIRKYKLTRQDCRQIEIFKQNSLWDFIVTFKRLPKKEKENPVGMKLHE